jgi:peptidoglycan hydrolase-like protein with peptidoglycan-binding domain
MYLAILSKCASGDVEKKFRKGEKNMTRNSILTAVVLGGVVALTSVPVWSQEVPGETRKPTPKQTKPGSDTNIPGGTQPGTPQLSKSDMMAVEEALQAKGYKVGKVDGVADNDTRAAIRAFQKDKGSSMTGMVDQRTADELGVKISSKSGGGASRNEPIKQKTGDDQSLPPGPQK